MHNNVFIDFWLRPMLLLESVKINNATMVQKPDYLFVSQKGGKANGLAIVTT